jgi:hypothetical protein
MLGEQYQRGGISEFCGLLRWRERFCEVSRHVVWRVLTLKRFSERRGPKAAQRRIVVDGRGSDREFHGRHHRFFRARRDEAAWQSGTGFEV